MDHPLLVDVHGAALTTPPTAPPVVASHYEARRTPEPGWRETLAQLSPPSDQVPYLWLDWLAGEPYDPVQRWAIWEVMPAGQLAQLIQADRLRGVPEPDILLASIVRDLQDPLPPRHPDRGRWVPDARVPGRKRWSADSLVNQQQWDLWQERRGFATLFWIIQGQHGGHKRSFSQREEQALKRRGLPHEAPVPGSLSFAPFDRRVLDQLERLDRLARIEGDFRRRARSHQSAVDALEARRVEEEAAAEREADLWLTEQTAAVLDELPAARISNLYDHLPVRDEPDRPILIRGGI